MGILTHFAQTTGSDYLYTAPMTTSTATDSGAAAFFVVFTLVSFVIAYVIGAYLLSRIFKKAGIAEWKAWVPVYNTWMLFELGGYGGWWAIILMVPFVGLAAAVVLCLAYYRIGLGFGKPGAFVLLAIFFPIVWMIWLAFDSSVWQQATQPAATTPTFQPPQDQTPSGL